MSPAKPRTRIPRATEKQLAKRKAKGLSLYSTTTPSKKPLKKQNKKRRVSTFARAYGSKHRVEFVKGFACASWLVSEAEARRCAGQIDNAHSEGSGMGIKADAATIVPLCRHHHAAFDEHRAPYDIEARRTTLRQYAREIDGYWAAHSTGE